MYQIKVIEYRGHHIKICYDEDPLNPRTDWDNPSTMICFHKRYRLGDTKIPRIDPSEFDNWDEIEAYLCKKEGAVIILPLCLYDHSGISMSIGTASDWDLGQIGFIYATRAQILEWFMRKRLSKNLLEQVEASLRSEVKIYNQYLKGEVFRFDITGPNCDDSGGGFFDQEDMVNETKACIDARIRQC
jgi:hypothetical protein